MGETTVTGEKPKFDFIAASKTKKYKITASVILVVGVLCLAISIFLRSTLTSAITPNSLTIVKDSLSGLDGMGPLNYTCTISQDETLRLSTGTPQERALANAITFIIDDDAKAFLEVRDKTNSTKINSSNYQGLFYLHIKDNAPEYVKDNNNQDVRPSGNLTIKCASKVLRIKITYHKK